MSSPSSLAPPTTPAAAHKKWTAHEFPLEYWWTIAGCVGVLAIINLFTRVAQWNTIRRSSSTPLDAENGSRSVPPRSTSSLGRLVDSIKAAANIVLYRVTIPLIGLNIAEFLVVGAYMGGTITWALSSSASPFLYLVPCLFSSA